MPEIKSEGQEAVEALNGKLIFEQGNNRIIGRDDNNIIRMSIDASNDFAVDFFDSNGKLVSSYDSTGQRYFDSDGKLISSNNADGQKYYDANGIAMALFNATGIKIAQSDIDVTLAGNDQLVFNSSQNVFKIVAGPFYTTISTPGVSGPVGGGWATNSTNASIAHGLGFVPIVWGFIDIGGGYVGLPWTLTTVTASNNASFLTLRVYSDATNVQLTAVRIANLPSGSSYSSGSYPLKYYLLQETAN